jgi:NADPH:quinone reductase-like Zn-dependent oxidoreductase
VGDCGVCGSDRFYIARGGIPPREGATPLGHEAAGEVIEVGDQVHDIAAGDYVVIKATGDSRGIIGNGGPTGALCDALLIQDYQSGRSSPARYRSARGAVPCGSPHRTSAIVASSSSTIVTRMWNISTSRRSSMVRSRSSLRIARANTGLEGSATLRRE